MTHETCAEQILHPCLPACFNERKVQEAFLRTFASLFYNYRIGFVDNPQEVNGPALASTGDYSNTLQKGVLYFSKEKFLKHADKDSRVSFVPIQSIAIVTSSLVLSRTASRLADVYSVHHGSIVETKE